MALEKQSDAKNGLTVVLGPQGSGKTTLSLYIAQQALCNSTEKVVYVQKDKLPFKAGRFYGERGLSLNLANQMYRSYSNKFDHMIASDALVAVQMARVLPEAKLSNRSYILDEVDSVSLLNEFLNADQVCSAVLCFRGLESIPHELKDLILERTESIYIMSTPADYAIDFNYDLKTHVSLFGSQCEPVCDLLAEIHVEQDMHSEFVVCKRNSLHPVLYRQWIDGDVDLLTEKGACCVPIRESNSYE